jgi:hypothetical protein
MRVQDRMHRSTKERGPRADEHKRRKSVDDLEDARQQYRDEDAINTLPLQPAPGGDQQAANDASDATCDAKQGKGSFEGIAARRPIGREVELDKARG